MSDYKNSLYLFLVICTAWFFLPMALFYVYNHPLMPIVGFMIGTLWIQYLGRGGIAKSDAG